MYSFIIKKRRLAHPVPSLFRILNDSLVNILILGCDHPLSSNLRIPISNAIGLKSTWESCRSCLLIYISSQTADLMLDVNNTREREAFKDKLYLATTSRAFPGTSFKSIFKDIKRRSQLAIKRARYFKSFMERYVFIISRHFLSARVSFVPFIAPFVCFIHSTYILFIRIFLYTWNFIMFFVPLIKSNIT